MQPTADTYKQLNQKPFESFYLYAEATLEFPVEKVWAQAINIGSWMSTHRLETIDGKSGEVGHFEQVYPRNLGSEVPQPHHHLYGVAHVIPHRLLVLEVLPEIGGSYGKSQHKMSFDNIFFTDLGGKTHICFYMIDVHLEKKDPEFCATRKRELAVARERIESLFENLRQLLKQQG